MKRDWQKVREVLELVEKDSLENKVTSVSGDEEDLFFGHLWLCIDAHLVTGCTVGTDNLGAWLYGINKPRLTMSGHDLLDSIRSETIWTAVKSTASGALIPVSVELIKSVAERLAKG